MTFKKPQQNGRKQDITGIKNYAGFGDQRCGCEYGYGPTRGTAKPKNLTDMIYDLVKLKEKYNECLDLINSKLIETHG